MKRAYRNQSLKPATLAMIETCNGIIEEYQEQGLRLTLRQLYYQLVSRNLIRNVQTEYKRIGSLVSDARLNGLMDWNAIEDRVRQPWSASEWEDLGGLVESALAAYRLPRWRGQENYVELWVEKDALAGVLRPIAHEYHVTLMVNRGYSSQSAMYESAQRIIAACDDGQEIHVLYLGDRDPSGEDMVRDIRDRLSMFRVEARVKKIALTTAQVKQYEPPENPVKLTDSRANGYIARHGEHCWEVDALPPTVLRDLLHAEFRKLVDTDKMGEVKGREETDKTFLRTQAAKYLKRK